MMETFAPVLPKGRDGMSWVAAERPAAANGSPASISRRFSFAILFLAFYDLCCETPARQFDYNFRGRGRLIGGRHDDALLVRNNGVTAVQNLERTELG